MKEMISIKMKTINCYNCDHWIGLLTDNQIRNKLTIKKFLIMFAN